MGVYTLKFIAKETRTGLEDSSVAFTLTVICQIGDLKPVYTRNTKFEVSYAIRGSPIMFAMPEYTWSPKSCMKKILYRLEN